MAAIPLQVSLVAHGDGPRTESDHAVVVPAIAIPPARCQHNHIQPSREFFPAREEVHEPLDVALHQDVSVALAGPPAVDCGNQLLYGVTARRLFPVVLSACAAVANAWCGFAKEAWHAAPPNRECEGVRQVQVVEELRNTVKGKKRNTRCAG